MIGDAAYDSNWYDFPLELRKYIFLMIVRSQKPIDFTGFGIIHCSLENFGKVSLFSK